MGSAGRGGARALFLGPAAPLADEEPVACAFVGACGVLCDGRVSAAVAATGFGGRDGWPGPSVEIAGDPVDDEGPAVDVDAPVCSSCRSFASMRAIFVSVLLRNKAQRGSARDSMPPRGRMGAEWRRRDGGGLTRQMNVRHPHS